MKTCNVCKVEKQESEFYGSHKNKDGLQSCCKKCTIDAAVRNRIKRKKTAEGKEKFREYNRNRKKNPETSKKYKCKYKILFPEKRKAGKACKNIPLKKGHVRHHWSYNKEHRRDIIEVTYINHGIIHKYMIYDQERMMYRKLDGVLLDTKNTHIEYINTLPLES